MGVYFAWEELSKEDFPIRKIDFSWRVSKLTGII